MPWTPTITLILRVIQFLVHIDCSELNHCVLCFTLASVGGPFLCTNNGPALVSGLLPDFLRTRVGDSLTWSCEAVGQTPPQYRWLKNFRVSENFLADDSREPFGKFSTFVRAKSGFADIFFMIKLMVCRFMISFRLPADFVQCNYQLLVHRQRYRARQR